MDESKEYIKCPDCDGIPGMLYRCKRCSPSSHYEFCGTCNGEGVVLNLNSKEGFIEFLEDYE
jgi:DnaJ-class molecular chaperone